MFTRFPSRLSSINFRRKLLATFVNIFNRFLLWHRESVMKILSGTAKQTVIFSLRNVLEITIFYVKLQSFELVYFCERSSKREGRKSEIRTQKCRNVSPGRSIVCWKRVVFSLPFIFSSAIKECKSNKNQDCYKSLKRKFLIVFCLSD